MTKIIIAGIGGVGGYFGGLLAKHYYNHPEVEIHFVARGEHLQQIKNNGLKVIKGITEFIAEPKSVTNIPGDIGVADYIIVCTKSYDLEKVIEQLKPCINNNTVILPLLNGVDSKDKIKNLLPENIVADGCVYIVSRLKQPGVIEMSGKIESLFFGLNNYENNKFNFLEKLLKEAGVQATLTKDISTTVWEKFIFISPTATATSYFNRTIGEVMTNDDSLEMVTALIDEVILVAKAKGIKVADDIKEKSLHRLRSLPFETTSSMHSDFINIKPNTELQSLTGYVISTAKDYGISTPRFLTAYEKLNYTN